ncbi:hypothetical protein RhiirC2_794669 [Rhizophagus irregularis]|uniref:Protein kinase domain-containing protein n=1 Tax=Rhizophagus irregularis TaxID=588596 RepID=A0A2N1MD61_9GLOM|nr:hypothetical protein RhiirC2_794669 [Rhizophagus irregularis]
MDSFGLVKPYEICGKCFRLCHAVRFQQSFKSWTSGDDDVDKFIQGTQLSAHKGVNEALEWIPYDRLYNIKYIAKDEFGKANWIDGNISSKYVRKYNYYSYWDDVNQNWIRNYPNMFVNLKSLNTLAFESVNKIKIEYEFYGITQDPETKNYMMVLNYKCEECNKICNAIRFRHRFIDWISNNDGIDKFIQGIQLKSHYDLRGVLEWIPYDKLYDIKYITKDEFGEVFRANWIDGNISNWDAKNQNWKRDNLNMFVNLKSLNTPNDLTFELANKIKIEYEFYGITQDPETKNYMLVLNHKCEACNKICNAIRFRHRFIDWISNNDGIDKFIQGIQLKSHYDLRGVLEWIPYDKLYDIKYITKDEFGEVFRANWIDGNISNWDAKNQNWKRDNLNMFVNLKSLNTPNDLTFELANKIKYEFYGITQDPETKDYMMVLNNKCEKCYKICNAIHFQHKFIDWTSSNDDIDKFIQDIQISAHKDVKEVLEWIPYDRFYDIKYTEFGKVYRANWIDGNISKPSWSSSYWDDVEQNWKRNNPNIFVNLKSLNSPNDLTFELANKVKFEYEFYGITQNPETKNYMMVLNNKCKKCNKICNAIHFQQKFIDWTSSNDDIDKFIQDTQLSAHNVDEALEWIPYGRLYDIKYISNDAFGKVYRANWIDGNISYWNDKNQNWIRKRINMLVKLKSLNTPNDLTFELANKIRIKHRFYGITLDPETKNYMMVLNNVCEKCNYVCNAIYFQQSFIYWASGNDDIDKFIQDTQSSAHSDAREALEWISYDRLYNIKYIAADEFGSIWRANWIDGNISYWENQNWKRKDQNVSVILKNLVYSKNISSELMKQLNKPCGITQDPETKNYMMVLNNECKKCNKICNAIHFQYRFVDWTSGNYDIDKFIQDTQLSAHNYMRGVLEWIPYDRFYGIKYISKDEFGEVYRANWIDGNIEYWDNENQNWERKRINMFVNLKSLNTPNDLIFELANKVVC